MVGRDHGAALVLSLVLASCLSDASNGVEIFVDADTEVVLHGFVDHLDDERIAVIASSDTRTGADASSATLRFSVATDLTGCRECYRIVELEEGHYHIRGDGILGAQYGVAHALEGLGYRFFHPWKTYRPSEILSALPVDVLNRQFAPEMSVRGIQLHTLNPIEALYAYWIPGEENLKAALRINDWLVKNRANYVQWAALDNIAGDLVTEVEWSVHTAAIIEDLHRRGMRAGISVQLFSATNIKRALNLIDTSRFDIREDPEQEELDLLGFSDDELAELSERVSAQLAPLLEADVDALTLRFGDFIGQKPQKLIDAVDLAYDVARARRPGLEVSAVIHVGDSEKLRITYDDNEMAYYFLVDFANPGIVPQVSTVMYYNLFEGAGGAYGHDDFDEHRDYLVDRLVTGTRAAYVPESAYWGAFDNSVPTYSPVYIRSRWLDIAQLNRLSLSRGGAPLDEHIVYSSGWEWGYWQNDYSTLRDGFALANSWEERLQEMFSPMGDDGVKLADIIAEIADEQQASLVAKGLAPYIAGRDAIMDAGYVADIVAAPERPTIEALQEWSEPELDAFAADVLEPLAALAAFYTRQQSALAALSLDNDWSQEVTDGVRINRLRAEFAHAIFSGAHELASGGEARRHRDRADSILRSARQVIASRRRELHHPDAGLLTQSNANPSLFQFGYLFHADTLCYWERELIQLWNQASREREPVPACFF